MKYQVKDRVLAFDDGDWIIPGTITETDGDMYKVEYDCGGYDWLLRDEIRPLEYHIGNYVKTVIGVGRITAIDTTFEMVTVSYRKHHKPVEYYENEVKPIIKPSLIKRLFHKDVYIWR